MISSMFDGSDGRLKPSLVGRPKAGTMVVLKVLPTGFLNDLPRSDQEAILAIVGKPLPLVACDDDSGRAELQFIDACGVSHSIWVHPDNLEPVT